VWNYRPSDRDDEIIPGGRRLLDREVRTLAATAKTTLALIDERQHEAARFPDSPHEREVTAAFAPMRSPAELVLATIEGAR
jgi:hypothetical protein